ncbi:RNase A-like domain-containing protein [Streptomyces luteolus]|uniref:Bacterial CdiA-CT RNAse A domain-containing protein n=1 Tax=Streptomyces luteolus TaxID=3043615 RepID=A0ABT6SQQ0_9ACTN|nr:RNase A-like domain-containing protein [Streptomyces sp. B-S-A12]MDI3417934.1 hypothetical protein [Streptomyces sp. B-S-A12]
MTTPPPTQNGKIDVTPTALYALSGNVAAQQDFMHKGMNGFLTTLESYPDSGGHGTAAEEFAKAYQQVGNQFVKVWAKAVVSIGGAAVGFTTTANNYAAADAATDPSGTANPTHQSPPPVIDTPPGYRTVTDLKWGDFDYGQSIWQGALEGLEGAVLSILRPLLEDACRWGKAAEVLPLPDYLGLDSISQAWLTPGATLGWVEDNLTTAMNGVTDQSNSEWYVAMRQFCSAIWGTSAWGRQREGYVWSHDQAKPGKGMSHPILAVLTDTCDAVSDALRAWAEAAETARDELRRIFYEAVMKALPSIDLRDGLGIKDLKSLGKGLLNVGTGLATGVVLEIDEAAMVATVTAYNNRVHRQIPELKKTLEALEEAYLGAPAFQAESARAEAFGARALTEFKGDPLYTVPGDDESKHKYPVDLANQEGMLGAHVIDKHVGKTDAQLEQRLRDQQTVRGSDINPKAASSFEDLNDAQRYTQATLDDPGNQRKIEKWLARNPDPNSSRVIGLEFNQPVGRTWDRGDSSAHDAKNVEVVLRPAPGGHPPYVVLTSMPTDKTPPP